MTKRESDRLYRYMRDWQQLLLLGGLDISLHLHEREDVPDHNCQARVEFNLRNATARIDVAEHGCAPVEENIIHEETHLVFAPIHVLLRRLKEHLAPGTFQLLMQQYEDEEERAVTALTQALRTLEERNALANAKEAE